MGTNFSQLFGNIRTPEDYKRAREEFELNKKLKRGQIDVQRAKIEQAQTEAANPTSNLPATLQVNAAIESALKKGDYDTANRIAWLTRSQAYGVDTFGPQGNTPETFKPFKPQAPAETQPQAQGEYVPTGQSIMPSVGSSIAQQLAAKAGMEAGAKERAKLEQKEIFEPRIAGRKAEESAAGKVRGGVMSQLGERTATMPQLLETVNRLSELGKDATYTYGGQAADFLKRQTGFGATEGGIARKEYISLVDNQILPLLRQTFGAQFTEREGQSLKATLGDVNASPEEKDAVLRSFIKQKMATINSLERQMGQPLTDFSQFEQGLGEFYQEPQRSGARREMEDMQGRFKKPSGRLVYNPATGEFE